mgnify:CR=1 FL=1
MRSVLPPKPWLAISEDAYLLPIGWGLLTINYGKTPVSTHLTDGTIPFPGILDKASRLYRVYFFNCPPQA